MTETATTTPVSPDANRDIVFVAGNVLGFVSIGFGAIAALVALIPVISLASFPLGIMSAFWGGIGFAILRLGRRGSTRWPLIGLTCAGVAIVVAIVTNVLFLLILGSS